MADEPIDPKLLARIAERAEQIRAHWLSTDRKYQTTESTILAYLELTKEEPAA